MTAPHLTPSAPSHRGPSRRTILSGATWAVPVVVLAGATPAFATSSGLVVALDTSEYSVTACSVLTGVSASVRRNNAPVAGTPVTVSLADGFRFADGTVSATGVTGADGRWAVPKIAAPASVVDSTLLATVGTGEQAAAALHSTAAPSARTWLVQRGGNPRSLSVPAGATPLGGFLFVKAGVLYNGDTAYAIASNVAAASTGYNDGRGTGDAIMYRATDGQAWEVNRDEQAPRKVGVPRYSTPLNARYFLNNGTLYYGGAGTVVATSVAATSTGYRSSDGDSIMYVTKDGQAWRAIGANAPTKVAVPNGSTPLNALFFVHDGVLYDGGSGKVITDGVVQTSDGYRGDYLMFRKDDGTCWWAQRGGAQGKAKVPNGAVPLDAYFFLLDGNLYNGERGVIAKNVASTSRGYLGGTGDFITYTTMTC